MTSTGRPGVLLLAAALLAATPSPGPAQATVPLAGRTVIASRDSLPAPGVRIILHQVSRASQGPVDSTVSDGQGRFRLRFRPDTTALYLLSARYSGIEYFSPPVNTNPALPDTALVVALFDTSGTQPVVEAARYLVIRSAGADGSRAVLDLVVLENRGALTRVAADTTVPSWQGRIPRGVRGVQVGEADLSADAITIRGDSILVFGPIAPGEKQIALNYAVPPGAALELRIAQDSVPTNVLTQDLPAVVDGGEMVAVDSQVIEGTTFSRWIGAPHAGEEIRVRFTVRGGGMPAWLLPAMVSLVALAMGVAFWRLRQRKAPAAALETLTDQVAQLDARYAGRESEVGPEAWAGYQAERDRLRAAIGAHLAARQPRR